MLRPCWKRAGNQKVEVAHVCVVGMQRAMGTGYQQFGSRNGRLTGGILAAAILQDKKSSWLPQILNSSKFGGHRRDFIK